MKRSSGVLLHISSLWGEYSSGSFGKEAREFVDFLADGGFGYWQVLPFCVVDECNSPYKSYSAFAGNPYFIDLEILYDKGLLSREELLANIQNTPYSCEFDRLRSERVDLLLTAARRAANKAEIDKFISEHPQLEKFVYYMALKAANDWKAWNEWENETPDKDTLLVWRFIQFEFFAQWSELKKYANDKGIKIIGDMPIYVAYDSADVWSCKEMFMLDEDGNPCEVAGVPPDYFSEDGQLWGNPIYNWDKMEKDGYKWWLERMGHMLEMFDGVRIDHFRGLESYYSIPFGAENAKNGKWNKGPGKKLIDKMKKLAPEKLIIAEDLGDITPEVNELVEYSTFPGMRVLQFGFLSDTDNIHKPHNYPENTVAYTGTHDNNTLLGYVWELDAHTRKELLEYCGYFDEEWDKGYDSIIRTMLSSHAGLVVLPIQDILGYGSDTRLNTPGKAENNWAYRVTKEQICTVDKNKYKKLNKLYGRV